MMQAQPLVRNLAFGFLAGALAVPTVHQLTIFLLTQVGLLQGTIFSMRPVPPWSVPAILSLTFWGGVWGLVLGLAAFYAPRPWPLWLIGLLLGAIALPIVSWFVVAPLKAQPIAAGWNSTRMLISVLINGLWGLGAGLILMVLHHLGNARGIRPAA